MTREVADTLRRASTGTETLSVLYAVLAGYGITGDEAVDAARFVGSTFHGFVGLELGGGYELPYPVDHSFERLVTATSRALAGW